MVHGLSNSGTNSSFAISPAGTIHTKILEKHLFKIATKWTQRKSMPDRKKRNVPPERKDIQDLMCPTWFHKIQKKINELKKLEEAIIFQ